MKHTLKFAAVAASAVLIASGAMASSSSNTASEPAYKPAGSGTTAAAPAAKKNNKLALDITQVQLIQYALKDLGHNPGGIDGKWGKASAKAVKGYQASVGETQTGTLNVATACYLIQVGTANHGSSAKIPGWCGFN